MGDDFLIAETKKGWYQNLDFAYRYLQGFKKFFCV